MFDRLRSAWAAVPQPVKLFIRDAIEAGIAAAASLTLTVPANVADAKREGVIVGVAIAAAIVAVARRELLPYVKARFLALFS